MLLEKGQGNRQAEKPADSRVAPVDIGKIGKTAEVDFRLRVFFFQVPDQRRDKEHVPISPRSPHEELLAV